MITPKKGCRTRVTDHHSFFCLDYPTRRHGGQQILVPSTPLAKREKTDSILRDQPAAESTPSANRDLRRIVPHAAASLLMALSPISCSAAGSFLAWTGQNSLEESCTIQSATRQPERANEDFSQLSNSSSYALMPSNDPWTLSFLASDMVTQKICGKYKLTHLLGEGGFGRVYHAKSLTTNENVAIKVVRMEMMEAVLPKWLKREISIHRKLRHPNIVTYLEDFKDNNYTCIVMEACSNGDLYDFLAGQPNCTLDLPRAATYIYQLADAISYLHAAKIMHRDLKPENALLGNYEELKICDFGIAVKDANLLAHSIAGTKMYFPPEMGSSAGKAYTEKVDEWCIGVMAYMMLCGKLPFTISDNDSVDYSTYTDPEDMDSLGRDLIKRILVMPENRLTAAQIMDHEFVISNFDERFFAPEDERVAIMIKKKQVHAAKKESVAFKSLEDRPAAGPKSDPN